MSGRVASDSGLVSRIFSIIYNTVYPSVNSLFYPCIASAFLFIAYLAGFKVKFIKYCVPAAVIVIDFLYCLYAAFQGAFVNSLVSLNFFFLPFIYSSSFSFGWNSL